MFKVTVREWSHKKFSYVHNTVNFGLCGLGLSMLWIFNSFSLWAFCFILQMIAAGSLMYFRYGKQ